MMMSQAVICSPTERDAGRQEVTGAVRVRRSAEAGFTVRSRVGVGRPVSERTDVFLTEQNFCF